MSEQKCPYFDAGWCYHPDVPHPTACVGIKDCMLDRKLKPKEETNDE
jgi:hypothetical protein